MHKFYTYLSIAFLAVVSVSFYFYFYITIHQNVESKLQEIAKRYPDVGLDEVVVLDSKILNTTFKKYTKAESVEYILQTPFGDKALQIKQDVTHETRLLWLFGLVLILVNFLFWIMVAVLLWQNKQKLKAVVTTIKTIDMDSINTLGLLNDDSLRQAIKEFLVRIQKYYEAKKQFYSGIAHELKTPLAVIKAKCEVTLLKPRENITYINALKENIESVNNAQAGIKSLFSLVNSGQIENIKKINVQRELENIAKDFALLHKDRRFDCILQTQELEILVNPTLFKQIIQNFLQNAFKFTPEDKCVCLKSYVENGVLKIEVLDEGSGILSDIDIFDPFKKDGKKEGMGLGLFLAKRAAKVLGGEIILENRKEIQGAIATFLIKI